MKLSIKLFTGFLLISALFMAVAVVNFRLTEDVGDNLGWVSRSQLAMRSSSSLQRSIVEMEAGLRGYLLNKNETFLEPYNEAKERLPTLFNEIKRYSVHSIEQEDRIDDIIRMQQRWQAKFAEPLIELRRSDTVLTERNSYSQLVDSMILAEKKLMDSIRTTFGSFNAHEYKLREMRSTRLSDSIDNTSRVSIILTIVSVILGLGWAYYITRLITNRIVKMVTLADKISRGEFKTQIVDTSQDELSQLSRSLNRMSATIDETFEELDRKNKELDQFAYVVSHDLKAPLRGIEIASRWVEEDMGKDLPHNVQEYLAMMRVRVHRMENLINGILALARIGRTSQIEEVVDVNHLLVDVVDMVSPPANFKIDVQDNLPEVYTVRVQLQQVFANLISNAIKYHDKDSGKITVTHHEEAHFHVFSVSDDGPGIDPQYHDRIFVIFQTLQERDAIESTGVGLAIVKKIVERQGGTIWVNSALGSGSTFSFTWPKSV